MRIIRCSSLFVWVAVLVWQVGCASRPDGALKRHFGESVVLAGQEPAALAYAPIFRRIAVRSTYQQDALEYVEGRDYEVDRAAGKLWRTSSSRIPDFRTNSLYGQREFDHTKFPGFGNSGFFAFVDYSFRAADTWPVQASQTHLLQETIRKLRSGALVRIVAFGDSITAGGDVTPGLIFWQRWAEHLQTRYPRAQITAVNGATGGDSTVQGLQRLEAKVLAVKPDLVLIGFGMNDHNVAGVPIPEFEKNLREMILRIRNEAGAETLLFSAFPPNPNWKFGTHRMEEFAAATERVAREMDSAYADVFSNWLKLASRKKPEDLLGNNINHPNDFGHWIYFQVLRASLP